MMLVIKAKDGLLASASGIGIILLTLANDSFLMFPTQTSKTLILPHVVFILGCIYMFASIWKKERTKYLKTIDILMGLYLLFSVLHPYVFKYTVSDELWIETLGLSLLYFIVRQIDRNYLVVLLYAVMVAGAIQAIVGSLQLYGILSSNHNLFKITGSFFNPGPFAGYLLSCYPIALIFAWKPKLPKIGLQIELVSENTLVEGVLSLTAFISFTLILLVIPSARSRAAILAFIFISICYLLYLLFKRYEGQVKSTSASIIRRYSLPILLAFIMMFVVLISLYAARKTSADGRLLIWKVSLEMFMERPLTGYGIGKFKAFYLERQAKYFEKHFRSNEVMVAGDNSYAFNEFILVCVERGIVIFLLVLAIIWLCYSTVRHLIWDSPKTYRRAPHTIEEFPPASRDIVLSSFLGILSIVIFGCFSYPSDILPIKINLIIFIAILASFQSPFFISKNFLYQLDCWLMVTFLLLYFWPVRGHIKELYTASRGWKGAYSSYAIGDVESAIYQYDAAYQSLCHRGEFLLNYGKALSVSERHMEAISILDECKKYLNNSIVETTLGDSYKAVGENSKAEEAYLKAWYMVPNRFYPKYQLAKLYFESGDKEKAKKIAVELIYKEVKIESKAVEDIKREMQEMLNAM